MSERRRKVLCWAGYEATIFALWLVGPVRGAAEASTSLAVLYMMHAYPMYEAVKRLGRRKKDSDK